MRAAVEVHRGARRAWPFLPALAPAGSVWQGDGGALVRVTEDGTVDEMLAGGLPRGGAARDPCNVRRQG